MAAEVPLSAVGMHRNLESSDGILVLSLPSDSQTICVGTPERAEMYASSECPTVTKYRYCQHLTVFGKKKLNQNVYS